MQRNHQNKRSVASVGTRRPLNKIALCSVWLVCTLIALSVWHLSPARAQVRPVNLKEMVESASTIVTGRVVEVREGRHPSYPNVAVTYVTLEVEEMLKGVANQRSRHVLMQFGGLGVTRVEELPTYRGGEEVVLFLYPESEYGFSSPVGGGQGKFYLRRNPQTGERVLSDLVNNLRLFEGIDVDKLSATERSAVRSSGKAIDYRTFASLVRRFAKN